MGVSREVDVDLVLGDDPGLVAAGATALDAENGAQGRLTKRNYRAFAELAQALGEPHARGRLALACGRRRDAGYDDQLALGRVGPDGIEEHLGLVMPHGHDMLGAQPQCRGDR